MILVRRLCLWRSVVLGLSLGTLSVLGMDGLSDVAGLRQKAAAGSVEAGYELGRALLRGEEVPRNLSEASTLLRSAAEAGHVEAMGAYGFMLARGLGMEANEQTGFDWIRQSAEAGSVSALLNQGIMTMRGQGVSGDPVAGMVLMKQAAESGSVEAQARVAEAYFLGEDGLVAKSEEEAARWAQRAAEAGHAWSQNLVGTMKEHGLGVTRDPAGAREFYQRAAEQGNAKAQASLGRLLHNGTGGVADRIGAYYWLKAGAEQGEVTARNFFGEVESGFTADERAAGEEKLREVPPPRPRSVRRGGPGPAIPREVSGPRR
jgi:TPR repeat protein